MQAKSLHREPLLGYALDYRTKRRTRALQVDLLLRATAVRRVVAQYVLYNPVHPWGGHLDVGPTSTQACGTGLQTPQGATLLDAEVA